MVEHLDRAEWVGVPSIVVGELRAGFRLGTRAESHVRELDEFLDHAVVEVLSVDAVAVHPAGRLYRASSSETHPSRKRRNPLPSRLGLATAWPQGEA